MACPFIRAAELTRTEINHSLTMPLPFPERPQPSEHPGAARFPKNKLDLIGWSATRLEQELGRPDLCATGDKWAAEEDSMYRGYVRQHDGRIIPQHWFGPRAPRIAVGQDYMIWRYNNAGGGSTCLLYLVESHGEQVVVDVDTYPGNAIS